MRQLGALLALLTLACSSPDRPTPNTATPPVLTRVTFSGAAPPSAIAPPTDPAMRDCARCHAERAAEHAESLHAQAFTNAIFEAAYSDEPLPSCGHCHAPRWTSPSTRALANLGVDCWTCHVRGGEVIGATRRAGSPHRGPLDPTMGEPEFCAGCHEFNFTDDVDYGLPPRDDLAQSTFSEWTRSAAAHEGVTCVDCHMPGGDHTVSVRRRPELIASALDFEASAGCVEGRIRVRVALRARDVGHAVPTGDLFRALVVRASTDEGNWAEHAFARHFGAEVHARPQGAIAVRVSAGDGRVPEPGFDIGAEVEFTLPASRLVRVNLSHHALPLEVAQRHGVLEQAVTHLAGRELITDAASPCATPSSQ